MIYLPLPPEVESCSQITARRERESKSGRRRKSPSLPLPLPSPAAILASPLLSILPPSNRTDSPSSYYFQFSKPFAPSNFPQNFSVCPLAAVREAFSGKQNRKTITKQKRKWTDGSTEGQCKGRELPNTDFNCVQRPVPWRGTRRREVSCTQKTIR